MLIYVSKYAFKIVEPRIHTKQYFEDYHVLSQYNRPILVSLFLWLSWISFVSLQIAKYQFGEFVNNIVSFVLNPFSPKVVPNLVSDVYFTPVERYMTFFTIALSLFLALIGFVIYLKHKKYRIFLLETIIYFGVITAISVILVFTTYNFVLRRILSFSFIGFSPMIAISLGLSNDFLKKIAFPKLKTMLAICILALMLITEVTLIVPSSRFPNLNEDEHKPQSTLSAALWLEKFGTFKPYGAHEPQCISGPFIYDLFNSFAYIPFYMNYSFIYKVFNASRLTESDLQDLKSRSIYYIISSKTFTKYPLGFDTYLIYPPISYNKIHKFDYDISLNRIHDNDVVEMWSITQ